MKKIALIIAATAVLTTGCSSMMTTEVGAYKTGIEVTQEQLTALKPGSKQSDVVASIGHPSRKEMLGEKELWYYDFTKIRQLGGNVNESTVFEFSKAGTLLQSYKTGNAGKTGNALLDAAK